MNWSVVIHVWSGLMSRARSLVISPASTVSMQTFSSVSANLITSGVPSNRSEEHTSELQSLMRISYAVFCLKKKKNNHPYQHHNRWNAQIDKQIIRTHTL